MSIFYKYIVLLGKEYNMYVYDAPFQPQYCVMSKNDACQISSSFVLYTAEQLEVKLLLTVTPVAMEH